MREVPVPDKLIICLTHLRASTLLALEASGGIAASVTDLKRLESIAQRLFGVSLERVECMPPPQPNRPSRPLTSEELAGYLQREDAASIEEFLLNLQSRVHSWLTREVPLQGRRK
jgi:hypothetical protein